MKNKIISVWSGPRNVSTALMYSFAQRSDTKVVDEPLYGYYLDRTDIVHPGREEILNDMKKDPAEIWSDIATIEDPVVFLKNMAHHAIDLNKEWYQEPVQVLLVRDPEEMLPSLCRQIPEPNLRDTGLKRQVELLDKFTDEGKTPVVIHSKTILLNPEDSLKKLCKLLSIDFMPAMLYWEPGKRVEDGIWAPYWYHEAHKSSGFKSYEPKNDPFPEKLKPLLEKCQPYYETLKKYSIN